MLLAVTVLLSACGGGDPARNAPEPAPEDVVTATGASAGGAVLLNAYFGLRDALVEADTMAADGSAAILRRLADSLTRDSLYTAAEPARALGSILAETDGLLGEKGLEARRRAFSRVGEELQDFLRLSGYAASTVYIQRCPMAFNDSEEATWLSGSREILNPYLGRRHPKYASGMLHCGELADSLGTAVR
jgi:hypothetical protein